MASGYPTPDEQDGDVTFGCIPVVVPNNPEFNQAFAAAIYGLYASMSKPHFWRELGTLSAELAAEYASRGLAQTDAYSECGDDCSGELLPTHSIITFEPQDPHTEPDLVPDGYLLPPFWVFGGVLPEFIGDWFGGLIEEITGYNLTDVLVTIGSFPILAGWDELITSSLPRIDVAVTGAGTLELHLLAVPFGGRVLITLDEIPTMADIVLGLYNDSEYMVDTVLDITSIPPETVEEVIIEYHTDIDTPHVFTATFIPVVDDELIPLAFGGGLRSVVWCGATIPEEECPECPEELTIPEIIADDTYFETEYVPVVFGEYYSETVANETAQAAAYDSTPQSIGADIPTGTPDGVQKNSLCAAINRFVSLYASTKLCLIQSQNFIEVFWNDLASSINEFYEQVVSLMSPIYSPNIFSCFVDDAAAMTALQNASAIEELACHIYDELKTVTMSQANFDAAILDAATVLTGDAQKIACLMNNDNNQSLYINLLEGYQIKLNSGDADCPCETSDYWRLLLDFTTGNRFGTTVMVWNGNNNDGQWAGNGYEYITPGVAITSLNVAFGLMSLGGAFVVRAYATKSNRAGSDNGGNDLTQGLFYSGEGLTGTNTSTFSNTSIPDGTDVVAGAINASATAIVKSFVSRNRVLQRTDTAPHTLLVTQCVIWGLAESGSGNKPALAQWAGNTLPGTLAGLFPS